MTTDNQSLVTGKLHEKVLVLNIQPAQIQDPETSERLGREMISIAEEYGVQDLVIDFSNVQFMGSIGFLALMRLRRYLKEPNILFCGLNATLKEVFEVCKLISSDPAMQTMFKAVDTVDQALELIEPQPR